MAGGGGDSDNLGGNGGTGGTGGSGGSAATSLLPFVAGDGKLLLFDPTLAQSGSNPVAVDIGVSNDMFGSDRTGYFTATVNISSGAVNNLRRDRLIYIKGGQAFIVKLTKGSSNAPVRISSLTDACELFNNSFEDITNPDNSLVFVRRRGPDSDCFTTDDPLSVIRVSEPTNSAGSGFAAAVRPIVRLLSAAGAPIGFLALQGNVLQRRDANFANPVQLAIVADPDFVFADSKGASLIYLTFRSTGQPADQLFRYDVQAQSLSVALHTFVQDDFSEGYDANNYYFNDGGRLLRIAHAATSATQITVVPGDVMITDIHLTNNRVVFETFGEDDAVYSAPKTAAGVAATPLLVCTSTAESCNPIAADPAGRVFINATNFDTGATRAVQVMDDGSGSVSTTNAYWAGESYASSIGNIEAAAGPLVNAMLLASRSGGNETLRAVNPSTGATSATLGTIIGTTDDGQSVFGFDVGRYLPLAVSISRGASGDQDAFVVDVQTNNSLQTISTVPAASDIPAAFF